MFRKLALLLAVVAATCVGAQTGHAQNNRTFVSNAGTGGNITQGCSASSPCDTFVHALSVTNSGGEIDCLNPGGFGAVTISKSVTINCEGASNGGITVSSGSAITINTGGIVVNLIGLDLNGENIGGSGPGVNITAAATVNIRNCKIYGFQYNGDSSGIGILYQPAASGGFLTVDNVLVASNVQGIDLVSTNGAANMTVRNSNVSNNIDGILINVAGGTHAGATIEQTTVAFNSGFGLDAEGSAGAIAVLGGSTVVNNGTGVAKTGGATIYSFKNNQIGGNGTDGTPLTAYPGGPLN